MPSVGKTLRAAGRQGVESTGGADVRFPCRRIRAVAVAQVAFVRGYHPTGFADITKRCLRHPAVGHFAEAGPNRDNLLESYHAGPLHLPEDGTLWPDPIHLAWHRKTRFKAARASIENRTGARQKERSLLRAAVRCHMASIGRLGLTGGYPGQRHEQNSLIAMYRGGNLAPSRKQQMQFFNIPENVIEGVASQIHARTNKDYHIPTVGTATNLETPQVFEIMPFGEIDSQNARFYAIDGSRNSHTFYNGVTLCFYQAGYVCFHRGRQIRMNATDDPVVLGKIFHGDKMLVLNDKDLSDVYDEFLSMPPTAALLSFFEDTPQDVFPYGKDLVTASCGALLGFCQEVLEWACVYDILKNAPLDPGDFILRDGPVRSLNIKQRYLVKLGYLLHTKKIRVVGVTKQSPIKTELAYTYSKIDNYLQSKLKPQFSFKAKDPKGQKLCCYFEVRDDVLEAAYQGSGSNMYAKKDITGGRGFGLFFTARLDYVEKLQNYDWLICDLNIYDCVPEIANKDATRDANTVAAIMGALTSTTQEHYILGYPYPLVEAHNLVSLTGDFQQEAIARVKSALYSSQQMDHTDIENLFLDLHSRF